MLTVEERESGRVGCVRKGMGRWEGGRGQSSQSHFGTHKITTVAGDGASRRPGSMAGVGVGRGGSPRGPGCSQRGSRGREHGALTVFPGGEVNLHVLLGAEVQTADFA